VRLGGHCRIPDKEIAIHGPDHFSGDRHTPELNSAFCSAAATLKS